MSPTFVESPFGLTARHKVDLNVKNKNGATPLHEAILAARNTAASLLLSMPGIKINLQYRAGETPLYMAAARGNEVVVRLLLLHGDIDVTLRDIHGFSAIEIAKKTGHTAVFKLLTQFVDPDGKGISDNSRTLLDLAWDS
ncbi:hypothetical protein DOTSEDRAFT_24425 [Dothistroma septosporum NZE10]|uniref:Uncharacterized protein n=1 Tax=Dothistroma septosporum (strain NZE10 / CBS 128990) TaxID=675120 RepID=N1PPR5_DOTSN|nr:hypothetical protein DOTSEDRAFT_24425 [Dothistroma septosporum NZE10]